MNFPILQTGLQTDARDMIETLFSFPGIVFTQTYFEQTRDWHSCLDLTDYCLPIVNNDILRSNLILLKLKAYYHLNYWQDYIDLYDNTVADFRYSNAKTVSSVSNIDERFIIGTDDLGFVRIHFLYMEEFMYRKVQKKLSALLAGKKTRHLECHSRTELTNEELERRHDYLRRIFNIYI